MTDYISREAAIASIAHEDASFVYAIERIPAADVRPVVRGKWRLYSPLTDTYECDKCGYQVVDESFRTNYCPNCGAWMGES